MINLAFEFSTTKWPKLGSGNKPVLISRLIFFLLYTCSLHRSCFTLTLEESPCNSSQWFPVKFPVLSKAILLSLCPPFSTISADSSPVPPSALSAHCTPPWSNSEDPLQFFWVPPGTGEPGGLLSMGSHRVGHDWSDLAAACVWNLGLFLKQNQRNFPIVFPLVTIAANQEKQLFLQWVHLLFSCWLTILWVTLRAKWVHKGPVHIHSNWFSSREPSHLNRLVLMGFLF